MITEQEKLAFVKIYMQRYAQIMIAEGKDLHQDFADELGISRQEAKVLCHRINYSLNFPVFR